MCPNTFDEPQRKTRMTRFVRSAALWVGFWFLCAFTFTFLMTHRIMGRSNEPTPKLDWGMAESFRLETCDGHELGAWFVDHSSGTEPAVLFLHGVKADRYQLLGIAAEFHRRGSPVMLITHRGHGDSSGNYNDFGYSCGPDVVAAVDWLRAKKPDRKVIVWGTSMGAASALFAAESLDGKVAGYILECPYQNIRIATRNRTKLVLPPFVEAIAYHTLNLTAAAVLPDIDNIAPENAAAKMPAGVPVLIMAGENDYLALPSEAQAIGERIGPAAKVVIAPGGGHTNLLFTNAELIRDEIEQFMKKVQ